MKILIGLDDSKFSKDVIRSVVGQFRTENTEVLVMHVLQPVEPVAPPEMAQGYAPELEDQKEPAHALVDRAAGELRTAGFKTHTAVEVGDVRDSILEAAAKWDADLVVVGSHGHRGIQSLLLGSVAESIARDSKCSVEIVRVATNLLTKNYVV
jgi:nucleotide-binding universal stress UspA family protein